MFIIYIITIEILAFIHIYHEIHLFPAMQTLRSTLPLNWIISPPQKTSSASRTENQSPSAAEGPRHHFGSRDVRSQRKPTWSGASRRPSVTKEVEQGIQNADPDITAPICHWSPDSLTNTPQHVGSNMHCSSTLTQTEPKSYGMSPLVLYS